MRYLYAVVAGLAILAVVLLTYAASDPRAGPLAQLLLPVASLIRAAYSAVKSPSTEVVAKQELITLGRDDVSSSSTTASSNVRQLLRMSDLAWPEEGAGLDDELWMVGGVRSAEGQSSGRWMEEGMGWRVGYATGLLVDAETWYEELTAKDIAAWHAGGGGVEQSCLLEYSAQGEAQQVDLCVKNSAEQAQISGRLRNGPQSQQGPVESFIDSASSGLILGPGVSGSVAHPERQPIAGKSRNQQGHLSELLPSPQQGFVQTPRHTLQTPLHVSSRSLLDAAKITQEGGSAKSVTHPWFQEFLLMEDFEWIDKEAQKSRDTPNVLQEVLAEEAKRAGTVGRIEQQDALRGDSEDPRGGVAGGGADGEQLLGASTLGVTGAGVLKHETSEGDLDDQEQSVRVNMEQEVATVELPRNELPELDKRLANVEGEGEEGEDQGSQGFKGSSLRDHGDQFDGGRVGSKLGTGQGGQGDGSTSEQSQDGTVQVGSKIVQGRRQGEQGTEGSEKDDEEDDEEQPENGGKHGGLVDLLDPATSTGQIVREQGTYVSKLPQVHVVDGNVDGTHVVAAQVEAYEAEYEQHLAKHLKPMEGDSTPEREAQEGEGTLPVHVTNLELYEQQTEEPKWRGEVAARGAGADSSWDEGAAGNDDTWAMDARERDAGDDYVIIKRDTDSDGDAAGDVATIARPVDDESYSEKATAYTADQVDKPAERKQGQFVKQDPKSVLDTTEQDAGGGYEGENGYYADTQQLLPGPRAPDNPWQDPGFPAYSSPKVDAQIFVFGYHATGTSLVARLLMVMGAYAGQLHELRLSQDNRLLYNERWDAAEANQQIIEAYYKATGKHSLVAKAYGFDWGAALVNEQLRTAVQAFKKRAHKVLSTLAQYPVSLLTDPKLSYTARLWVDEARVPVCVIPFRHPYKVALRLLGDEEKGAMGAWSPSEFMKQWYRATVSSLRACVGHPTIIVPEPLTQVPYHQVLLGYLLHEFKLCGVSGMHKPTSSWLRQNYDQHYDSGRNARGQQFPYPELSTRCAGYREVPELWMQATSESRAGEPADVAAVIARRLRECDLTPLVEGEAASKVVNFFQLLDYAEQPPQQLEVYLTVDLTMQQKGLVEAMLEFLRARFAREDSRAAQKVAEHVLQRAGIVRGRRRARTKA